MTDTYCNAYTLAYKGGFIHAATINGNERFVAHLPGGETRHTKTLRGAKRAISLASK